MNNDTRSINKLFLEKPKRTTTHFISRTQLLGNKNHAEALRLTFTKKKKLHHSQRSHFHVQNTKLWPNLKQNEVHMGASI